MEHGGSCPGGILLHPGGDEPAGRDHTATLAFIVADAAGELERLRDAGATITLPLMDEPWGERLFQVQDPNGVIVQLVEWVASARGWIQPVAAAGGKQQEAGH